MDAVKKCLAERVAETMKGIWNSGMTTATGGNISAKDSEGSTWTTPSGVDKGVLTYEDIVCINPEGDIISPKGYLPTSEFSFHRAIYKTRPDLKAVIHAHPPALVSFSLAGKVPDIHLIPHIHRLCGSAGFAPYKISGSEDLADRVAEQVQDGHNCIIMENHATVVAGSTLDEAYQRFEAFETCAKIIINAKRLGNLKDFQKGPDKATKPDLKKKPVSPGSGCQQTEKTAKIQICEFAGRACKHNLMLSSIGSMSVRLENEVFIITPDDKDHRYLSTDDLVRVTNDYEELGPSSDISWRLHKEIYNQHPEVHSVITSCAPYSMAFGLSGTEIDIKTSPEGYVLLRNIAQLGNVNPSEVASLISENSPCILAENYALIVTGKSILQAFERLEVTEFTARSLIDCLPIEGAKRLSEKRLKELKDKFIAG